MKNTKVYYNGSVKVEIWSEYFANADHYWMKINGITYPITEKQFNNRLKKAI